MTIGEEVETGHTCFKKKVFNKFLEMKPRKVSTLLPNWCNISGSSMTIIFENSVLVVCIGNM